MNILILNWRDPKNPKSGGAETVTMGHAESWVKRGHKVTWFTSKFNNSKKEEMINGIRIVRWGNYFTVYVLAPLFYLSARGGFDLVVDEIHGLPFFTPLYVKKPKIAFIHEVADTIWDFMYPFPINVIGKIIEPFYFKLYKNIPFWTDAKSTINDLTKFGIKESNCTAIHCPAGNVVVGKLPKKENNPTFIFVSRVVKMKGIEEVIRAFFYIILKNKNAKLWIIGDGKKSYVEELKDMMKNYDIEKSIKFFGLVSEKKKLELMKKAHVLLHASVKEGWGLVVIEAASQATPSIVYNVSGLKNSVIHNKTGLVLAERSARKMASQALELVNNKEKYRDFQTNCLNWAKSLTWDRAANQSLDLLVRVYYKKEKTNRKSIKL